MSNYTQVSKGSSGDSVKELQKLLNQNGYGLTEDGIFGDNTLAAVKDYQHKNGLTVDGIVGNNTWGALTGGSSAGNSSTGSSSNTSKDANGYQYEDFQYDDFTYGDYQISDTVKQADAALRAHLATKPGAYQSQWSGQIGSVLDQYMNREDFSYDVNSDALYQQYKDQYTALGKLAMQDTMGQAAAMTGGYGSSYASAAGNQAYQSYLSQLNEVVPELYGMARDAYNQEGQELLNQYGLLTDQENQDYGRYIDSYNQWESETNRLQGVYNDERTYDYNQYTNERGFAYDQYTGNRNLAYDEHTTKQNLGYNEYRNAIEDDQWQQSFNASNEQWATSRQDAINSENRAYAREEVLAIIANGGIPDEEQLKTAGLTKASAEAMVAVSSGNKEAALQHVGSMSPKEIVETMHAYSYVKDNQGLAAFLDDCVATGRMTEEQADEYYDKFRTGTNSDKVDTKVPIVKPNSGGGGAVGGGVGKFATTQAIK